MFQKFGFCVLLLIKYSKNEGMEIAISSYGILVRSGSNDLAVNYFANDTHMKVSYKSGYGCAIITNEIQYA